MHQTHNLGCIILEEIGLHVPYDLVAKELRHPCGFEDELCDKGRGIYERNNKTKLATFKGTRMRGVESFSCAKLLLHLGHPACDDRQRGEALVYRNPLTLLTEVTMPYVDGYILFNVRSQSRLYPKLPLTGGVGSVTGTFIAHRACASASLSMRGVHRMCWPSNRHARE